MTPRGRLHEAFLDVISEMPADLIDRTAGILENLLCRYREARAMQPRHRAGNVVAVPVRQL